MQAGGGQAHWAETLDMRKRVMRAELRAARRAIPEAIRRRAADAIGGRVLDLPVVRAARTVALFSSFGSEVSMEALMTTLTERGKRVLLPFLDGTVMAMADAGPEERLVASGYGPREPANCAPVDPATIDVVVLPGLAFDRSGNRLGYGGGHFDRFLGSLPRDTVRIGVCFAAQLLDEVPHGPADRPVDLVVTEAGIVEVEAGR